MIENFESGEGDGDFGIGVVGIVNDVGDVWIVWDEGFEDVVVIIEIESDSVSHNIFSFFIIGPPYIVFEILYTLNFR